MTPGQWLAELQTRLGHSIFPDNYFVFDVETTGTVFYGASGSYTPGNNGYHDIVTQIGHCIVRNGEVKHYAGSILDWTPPEARALHEFEIMREPSWVEDALQHLVEVFEASGRVYQVPADKMKDEGVPPVELLEAYYQLFTEARKEGLKFVGHNAWGFDAKMMRYHFRHYLGKDFKWRHDEIIDTGMIEKAIQDRAKVNVSLPWSTENLKTWSRRMSNSPRRGIYWNLDRHATKKYDLVERYNLDMTNAHDAGFDCYMTHLLLDTYKGIYETEVGSRAVKEYCDGEKEKEESAG